MKPIRMCNSLRVADKVRKAVSRLNTSLDLCQRGYFETFDNCREQGYVLQVFGPVRKTFHIAFSENRNSDDIVVYCFENTRFPNNIPADVVDWKDVMYFPFEEVDRAAQYILNRATMYLSEQSALANYEKSTCVSHVGHSV